MDSLPNELIYLIANNIEMVDKRIFLRISKKYYKMSKILMVNIKYAIFSTDCDDQGINMFNLRGVFDNLDICRKYIKNSLLRNPITRPSHKKMTVKNNYTMVTNRLDIYNSYKELSDGFIIEEIVINEFI